MSDMHDLLRDPAARRHADEVAPSPPAPAAGGDDTTEAFARDLLHGLAQPAKSLPCVWFYDRRGSELFERITALEAYYPTRTETRLLEALAPELAARIGPDADLVELGSGSSAKTRVLLRAMPALARYVPIDVSAAFLAEAVQALRAEFPALAVEPVVGDFTGRFTLPPPQGHAGPRLAFFPGSTIGNFTPEGAVRLLGNVADRLGPASGLLIGVDTTRDVPRLLRAYDDPQGVTAQFNLNLLQRANRELGADFDLGAFRHEARWNAGEGRVEMHLVSDRAQRVTVRGRVFGFAAGEGVHTENAYKFDEASFRALARRAGWTVDRAWRDDRGTGFAVFLARSDG